MSLMLPALTCYGTLGCHVPQMFEEFATSLRQVGDCTGTVLQRLLDTLRVSYSAMNVRVLQFDALFYQRLFLFCEHQRDFIAFLWALCCILVLICLYAWTSCPIAGLSLMMCVLHSFKSFLSVNRFSVKCCQYLRIPVGRRLVASFCLRCALMTGCQRLTMISFGKV